MAIPHKSSHPMLHRLVLLFKPCQHTPKRFENDQINIWFSVQKGAAVKPLKRERQKKNINCRYPDISWNSRCFFLWNFHTNFPPLFNRFSIFDKNVNLSKTNPEAENFLLAFPSLNTSIFFTTYPKIASTLRPFEGLDSKVTLPNSEV